MSGLPGLKTVGLLGGGVIGGAWAARFALNGVDVKLYDIDPQATRKMGEIMGNARRAYRKLTLAPLPQEGTQVPWHCVGQLEVNEQPSRARI